MADYDLIGKDYPRCRQPDPRIASRIRAALGDSRSIANVGAGTGSYEPVDCLCLGIDPSQLMIRQRPAAAAAAVQGRAEALPLGDGSVDAALAILTLHHWTDTLAGLSEMRRVARNRVVILTWDQTVWHEFWVFRDYFPDCDIDSRWAVPIEQIRSAFKTSRTEVLPIPHDCIDGFHGAYWRRPLAYLDPKVRSGISTYSQMPLEELNEGLGRLASDLDSGHWYERNRELLELEEKDLGYRLIIGTP